jgi:flagellar M-ring protein FliF
MSRFLTQLSNLWKQLGLNQRISLVLAAAVVVAAMVGVLAWSSRPDMQVLYARLDPKDAAEIATSLDAQGIAYQVSAGGTTVSVPRRDVHRVRMELASKGLPTGGSVGFEIFDQGNFGISDFVQRTNYLRAIQGELSRTISQLDGVRSARVMVVMPENRLLVTDTNRRSTASVLVDTGGSRLATDAVSSIRSLVANAVEGLRIDDVVVVDNRGNVLSEELQQDGIGGGLTAGQIRYRKSLEDYFSRKVESMLGTVLGPGNAVVRVSVDVDQTSSTVIEERFDPEAQILRSSTVTEDSTASTETRPPGAVGVGANVPAVAADDAAPTSNSQQTRKSKTESYEIGRSTINTVRNAGEIRRVSAAVFVAARATGQGEERTTQPRTPAELEILRQMVVNALGVVPPRGQSLDQIVSVQEVDFAADLVAEQAEVVGRDVQLGQWIELGQKVLVVLFAIGAFLFFLRLIKRGQAEGPTLELYQPGAAGASGRNPELERSLTPEMLNEMIRQKPGNVGLTLKEWMSAGQK